MEIGHISDRSALAAAQNVKECDYWLEHLSGELNTCTFPYDYNKQQEEKEIRREQVTFSFPGALFAKTVKLSGGSAVKLHMILVTGVVISLSKYAGSRGDDIITGSPILKQKNKGEFINKILVFRNRLWQDISFKELLMQVRETIIKANENQNYPMEVLLDQLGFVSTGNKFPLFDVVVLLRDLYDKCYVENTGYDVLFSFSDKGDRIEGDLEYNANLYRKSTMERLAQHYVYLLDQALTNVDVRVSGLEFMTGEEKKQVLTDFNNAVEDTGYPQDKPLHRLFEDQMAKKPGNMALVARSETMADPAVRSGRFALTYDCLNERVNRLARLLRSKGIKPGTIAGIIAEPSIEMMVGLLAILKAGGAYLPIDIDYPIERIRFMLADSNAKLVLTVERLFNENEKVGRWDGETVFIEAGISAVPDELASGGQGALLKNRPKTRENAVRSPKFHTLISAKFPHKTFDEGQERRGAARFCVPPPLNPDVGAGLAPARDPAAGLAYIIYTSGTTGKPKGVMVEHRNVVAYLHSFFREFDINERDIVIQMASFAFDVFIEEVFPVLLRGGKVFIPYAQEMMDIGVLCRLILDQGVTIIDCTPLLLNELDGACALDLLRYVRIIISGGDVLKREYIENLLKNENARVYNTYGPTESTVCATYYKCSGSSGENGAIPIGKPVSNYRVYILDSHGNPVPIGVYGELCAAGPGITRGYLNRPELTAEKFPAARESGHKFSAVPLEPELRGSARFCVPPLKLYKTGDRVRWLPDGNIEYSGRTDNQVKIRGFRIEMGEIENCLRNHEDTADALVTPGIDQYGDRYICAYIIPVSKSKNVDEFVFREYLSKMLPYYMVPERFVFIEKFPLNRNGKIDKKRLPEPGLPAAEEYVPPGNRVEEDMVNIYAEILQLNVDTIGINDNFFTLGGNSIKLIKLTARIREVFGSNIPLTQILHDSTIRHIANLVLGSRLIKNEEDVMVLLNQEKPEKIFCFPPVVGYGLVYMELARFLEDYSVYAFNFTGEKELIAGFVDRMVEARPDGPFVLFAYSAGGKFALKAANLLEKRGYRVSAVILMECYLEIENANSAGFEQRAMKHFENFKSVLFDLGGDTLSEKVLKRVRNYNVFFDESTQFETIAAPIHYIKAEDKKGNHESLGWERLTNTEYNTYDGFGNHTRMLEPIFAGRNAEIIKKILQGIT